MVEVDRPDVEIEAWSSSVKQTLNSFVRGENVVYYIDTKDVTSFVITPPDGYKIKGLQNYNSQSYNIDRLTLRNLDLNMTPGTSVVVTTALESEVRTATLKITQVGAKQRVHVTCIGSGRMFEMKEGESYDIKFDPKTES